MPPATLHDIPDLLHDAQLIGGEYDEESRELRLTFDCLRRHTDGSAMEDRKVTLRLAGVSAVTAAYDTDRPEDGPSEFRLPDDTRVSGLAPWPLPPMEVGVSLDSLTAAESLQLAAYSHSLVSPIDEEAAHLVSLEFRIGMPQLPVQLAIRCKAIEPYASGHPLPLDVWAEEFAAWWRGWEAHWASTDTSSGAEPSDEDSFLPAEPIEIVDRRYTPPGEPAFACPPNRTPEDLLSPIRIWFEAGLTLDASRRVSVAPNLDQRREEQIASEHAWMTGDDYGSWDYACEIVGWWIEGERAYVGVAGVTHYMPSDGEPAENQLSRWAFALRRRRGLWQIHSRTSAVDDDLASRPWAQRWFVKS